MIGGLFVLIIVGILFIMRNSKNSSKRDKGSKEIDINKKVSICVKTLYRSKAIGKFVTDTRKIFPNITIIIADDSDDEYKKINKKSIQDASPYDPNIIYIPLPFNSGLSNGRNECVKRVKTPYTIITDDTRIINNNYDVYRSVDYLDKNKQYDMITGNIPERYGVDQAYTNIFDYVIINGEKIDSPPKILKMMDNLNNNIEIKTKNINKVTKDGYDKTDIGVNSFIIKTGILKKYPWNDNLKIGEHVLFFLKLWVNNINILYDKNFIFNQFDEKYRVYDKDGSVMRYGENLSNISMNSQL